MAHISLRNFPRKVSQKDLVEGKATPDNPLKLSPDEEERIGSFNDNILSEVNEIENDEVNNSKYPGGHSFLNMTHQYEVHLSDHEKAVNH